ncbi:MAG: carboxypeptidase regulatory-like domain-containing protein, partial [Desulfuromonadaceae bacterium]|nr:carboxypeptidase regulatory-like domain-containing protein [Desulfuromonadaceae bacterium]
VDSKGAKGESQPVKFTYTPQNALLAFILGTVIDQSGNGVASAKVKMATKTYTSLSNGYVLIPSFAGIYSLTAEKTGYTSATQSVTASSGKVSRVVFTLTEVVAPTIPGDCDGDEKVTIAEVQSAINMFLGLKTAEACVDTDGLNGVSIAEVQKTINSFLGL